MLTNDEWDLLRDLIPILGLFEEATTYLGGSDYTTQSLIKPLITNIINKLKPLPEENVINIDIEGEDVFLYGIKIKTIRKTLIIMKEILMEKV